MNGYRCARRPRYRRNTHDAGLDSKIGTRQRLFMIPKRDSMNARVIGSSGSPPERMTSCTIEGTGFSSSTVDCRLPIWRCSLFFRHSWHSPFGPGVPPHAHLRCSRRLRSAVIAGFADDRIFVVIAVLNLRSAAAFCALCPSPDHGGR